MAATIKNRVQAVEADITTLALDAIVNAANAALMPGGGVDGAIRRKAGAQLDEELYRIGRCEPGTAVITSGYHLPAKHVIHTVAPFWSPGRKEEEDKATLARCYSSVLKLADKSGIATIAFPAIGTGAYRWPADIAAGIAFKAVVEHLGGGKQQMITFCCFSAADRARYEALIAQLRE